LKPLIRLSSSAIDNGLAASAPIKVVDHPSTSAPIADFARSGPKGPALPPVGDRDNLELGADGSLEIAIQRERPSGSDANWLPAPEGDFN